MDSEQTKQLLPANQKLRVAYITAGGAGMFCGSCMQDNTLAKSLHNLGVDVTLIPTYTPPKLDEPSVANSKVFIGGINAYLDWKSKIWRMIPRFLTRWLDSPRVLNWAGRLGVSNDAAELGGLAEAMLLGESGPERELIQELSHYLTEDLKPDVILFSNALLVGTLREIRSKFKGQIVCVLQGDDLFLNQLNEPYQERVFKLLQERVQDFDRFLMHSKFYKKKIVNLLQIDETKCEIIPLGIDAEHHTGKPKKQSSPFTIGYFARIAPEKGLLNLVRAFCEFHKKYPDSRLRVGGNLNREHRGYFEQAKKEAETGGVPFEYIGSPNSHAEKVAFYSSLDILSVPTAFEEPKGLYVLEALCNGVPVVQPRHGAFPELIKSTNGGLLFDANDSFKENLAAALIQLKEDEPLRMQLATAGYQAVREQHSAEKSARTVLEILSD